MSTSPNAKPLFSKNNSLAAQEHDQSVLPQEELKPMCSDSGFQARAARYGPVIALHCSGSGAGQWRQLGQMLGADYKLFTPEHYGSDHTGPWTGEHTFTLADEAVRTIALIDGADRKVHLVGHSYGGGVALHAALLRPCRIASLTLYEPSAFHLLKEIGAHGAEALAEITSIARETGNSIITGDYRGAAASFVDYWSGKDAWSALHPELQRALTRWAPKAPLDFAALIEASTQADAYARLHFPARIVRGEHAPTPSRLIAETLATLLPNARLTVIPGAGHMGPLTHTAEVNAVIIQHIAGVEAHMRQAQLSAVEGHGLCAAAGATS
jgi:pimeloyl-ACP methyl ester carboxylesterase